MGNSVMFFGLCVILVGILGTEYEVTAAPIPFPDLCFYRRHHHHHPIDGSTAAPATTTLTPEQKAAVEQNQKKELIKKLFPDIIEWEKLEKKPEEKQPEVKNEEPKGFSSMNEFWNTYLAFLRRLFNSWYE